MRSASKIDNKNDMEYVFDEDIKIKNVTPYTFTKIENGKKTVVDSTSIVPPSWLLLDHTIAVVWSMFSLKPYLRHLSIDDLKWAYEFLKEVRNDKGETPPDVKTCLKEIQDRLINLYAKLTNLKEDFDEISAAFGDSVVKDSGKNISRTQISPLDEDKLPLDTLPVTDTIAPYEATSKIVHEKHSSKDFIMATPTAVSLPKQTNMTVKTTKKMFPTGINSSSIFDSNEDFDNEELDKEELEKILLSIFPNEKKRNTSPARSTTKSFIPMKKRNPTAFSISEMTSKGGTFRSRKTEKTSKKLHCVAEMRSLKFQKSMKVQDMNGEEAAYSNLKAEIQRLTFNQNVSRDELMKFLKDWRSEQYEKLNSDLKKLNSIEEFMKNVNKNGVDSILEKASPSRINELGATKSFFSLQKSLLT